MGEADGRRAGRIARDVEELLKVSRGLAMDRIDQGGRRWTDFKYVAADLVEPARVPLMAAVPVCVARRRADPELGYWRNNTLELAMMLAHPPDVPLPTELETAMEQLQTRWRTEPDPEFRDWAWQRLTLGVDGGEEMRQRTWAVEDGTPVLSDEVVDAATRQDPHLGSDLTVLSPGDARQLEVNLESFDSAVAYLMLLMAPSVAATPASVMTLLEMAVLIDPSPDPPWLSRAGRTALTGDFAGNPILSHTMSSHSALYLACAQVHWRCAVKNWHRQENSHTALGRWLKTQCMDC